MGLKMFTYDVITHFDRVEFIKLVNDSLENGWELHGSLVVTNIYDEIDGYIEYKYFQTVKAEIL